VNTVFRMQGLLKALPDGILISDTTLRAAQSNLGVALLETSPEVQHELGQLTIYELTGSEDSGRRVRTGRSPVHADVPAPRPLPAGNA
jgi:class 3 adenylate cyclase